jgi:protocatechuate 3,4-dioxygenase beta subunit
MRGTLLVLAGRVLAPDCRTPLAGAVLDFWQADHDGHYDNDGSSPMRRDTFRLRGLIRTDAEGRYELRTIIPGHYLNGAQYRPAHIHAKVRASGHEALTTQLYFSGDPYNSIDPFIKRSLIMALADDSNGAKRARFDFVLARG